MGVIFGFLVICNSVNLLALINKTEFEEKKKDLEES
jgi:hypothetical protein